MSEETTYGLSPGQLARLLAIGLEGTAAQEHLLAGRTLAELLEEMLAGELPLDPAMLDSLPAVLNRPCHELLAVAGRALSDLLLNPETDLAVIKTLKDYAKKLVRRAGPEAKQAAATAIYYTAIASALVHHEQKITRHSYEKLNEAYADLEQKPWIPSELKDLFGKARSVCRERKAE